MEDGPSPECQHSTPGHLTILLARHLPFLFTGARMEVKYKLSVPEFVRCENELKAKKEEENRTLNLEIETC